MTSPLEKLRTIARRRSPGYGKNEINRPEPPADGLLSFNSFISSPDNPQKRAGVSGQDEPSGLPSHADDRAERAADTAEGEAGIRGERFAALSGRRRSPVETTFSPVQLLAITRNTPHLPYEKNERNEISPSEQPPERLLSFNSFLSSSEETGSSADRTDPRAWLQAFAGMVAMPTPTGFSAQRWQRVIDAAGRFLERWADVASACGWSDLDVFGCDSNRPDARFDCMGIVLLLDRCEVVGVDENGADLVTNTGGARLRFYRRPLPASTIRLWELAR